MLTIYRRHTQACIKAHGRDKGRTYRRCRCPLHVEGTLAGEVVRRALDLTSWEAAENVIREWNVVGQIGGTLAKNETVTRAVALYLEDCIARKLSPRSVDRYRRFLVRSLIAWCDQTAVANVRELTFEAITRYRATWTTWSAYTSAKNLELLRMFIRFCRKAKWIDDNPAEDVASPTIRMSPTLPFSDDEVRRIIAACDQYRTHNKHGKRSPERLRAFVLALRFTGLRIGDLATLSVDRLEGNSVLLYTHKTGVPVYVPIPPFVGDALRAQARLNATPAYFFWTGVSTVKCATVLWQRSLATLFRKAKVEKPATGHNGAHRFRDTFAVSLLVEGVPIEDVAILLGHATPEITAKHYSPWVRARRERLEERVAHTWNEPRKFQLLTGEAVTG